MARPLSLDLRERIVKAVRSGLSRRAAAERFQVSESCAIKLLQRWERTGSVAPAPRGKKPFALERHASLVRELVAAQPDITIDELKEQLAVAAVRASRSAIHRFLQALGLTLKKRRSMPASKRGLMLPSLARSGVRYKAG